MRYVRIRIRIMIRIRIWTKGIIIDNYINLYIRTYVEYITSNYGKLPSQSITIIFLIVVICRYIRYCVKSKVRYPVPYSRRSNKNIVRTYFRSLFLCTEYLYFIIYIILNIKCINTW